MFLEVWELPLDSQNILTLLIKRKAPVVQMVVSMIGELIFVE